MLLKKKRPPKRKVHLVLSSRLKKSFACLACTKNGQTCGDYPGATGCDGICSDLYGPMECIPPVGS